MHKSYKLRISKCGFTLRIPHSAISWPRFGQRRQVSNGGFGEQAATHPFNENFHAVPGGNEAGDQNFPALGWGSGHLNTLSPLQRLIDLHQITLTRAESA